MVSSSLTAPRPAKALSFLFPALVAAADASHEHLVNSAPFGVDEWLSARFRLRKKLTANQIKFLLGLPRAEPFSFIDR